MVYEHMNSKGIKYFLHKKRGKGTLYYFSKDPKMAVNLPPGYDVIEHPTTKLPLLKKKA
ncbi:MAG: hypothetical protein V1672_02645 [Candidatus Diapherotrites archaeon]